MMVKFTTRQNELITQHYNKVIKITKRFVNWTRNEDEIYSLAHDVLIRCGRNFKDGSFVQFFTLCLKKELGREYKKYKKNLTLDPQSFIDIPAKQDKYLEEIKNLQKVLSPFEKDIINLKYYGSLSNIEIADLKGCSCGYVSRIHTRAINKMRAIAS